MSQPILVTGAACGRQGSTGNRVAQLLVQRGLKVRALVHHVDER
jgi:nucleoside-diphosphate-sugar epimerase